MKILSRARIRAGWLYLKRIIFWNSTLSKYLSGDFFAKQCEFIYEPHSFRFIDRFKKDPDSAHSIFCESHNLERFVEEFGSSITAKILVLGNSDRDFNENNLLIPKSVETVYAQNLNFEDNKFKLLPIGLENMRLGRNIFLKFVSDAVKKDEILVGPFSPTHREREEIMNLNFSEIPSTVVSSYSGILSYRKLLSEHKYVLCPRGNGMDTHRFWEVIYSGGVPIVKKCIWSNLVKKAGVPLVEVNLWSIAEISRALKDYSQEPSSHESNEFLATKHWKQLLKPH